MSKGIVREKNQWSKLTKPVVYKFEILIRKYYSNTQERKRFVLLIFRLYLYTCGLYTGAPLLTHVQLFVTPWTVVCQAPLSTGFYMQEYWVATIIL